MEFVGRESELGLLAARCSDARHGRGSFVTVTGPSGIGKSALVRKFVDDSPDDTSVVMVQCVAGGAPFAPWERVTAMADRLSANPPAAFDSSASVDLADRAEFVLERLAHLPAPVVVVLDDLHEADDGTRQLLSILASSLTNEPVMVVGTIRAPRRDTTLSVPIPRPTVELPVSGLTVADIVEMLRAQMPRSPEVQLERVAEALHASTGGNPFALRSELIDDDNGGPSDQSARNAGGDALSRVTGRLSPAQREMLIVASLLRDSDTSTVLAAAGCDRDQLQLAAEVAAGLRLLQPAMADGDIPVLHSRAFEQMMATLPEQRHRQIHGRIAGALLGAPGASPNTIVHHAVLAGDAFEDEQVADIAERAGFDALRALAFEDADRLLAFAHDRLTDEVRRLRCLLGRAEARHRQGDLEGASSIATTAAHLASRLHRADDLAEAAIRYAHPPDWRSKDQTAGPLLAAAERAEPSPAVLAKVLAVRSVVEMRVPVDLDGNDEWNWETRPDVAQPIAERAVALAREADDPHALLMSLLAWRNTHRAPRHLARRIALGTEALALAQRLRSLDLLAEAGLRKATDELEAGNRDGFEESVIMASWAADRSTEPRLIWRAASMEATRAVLDGDAEALISAQDRATRAAARGEVPGSHVSTMIFMLLRAQITEGVQVLSPLVKLDRAEFRHPLGRSAGAWLAAVGGDFDLADEMLRTIPFPLDEEASLLVTATLAGRAAVALGEVAMARRILDTLEPWTSRYAIDSECLLPIGPVADITAQLRTLLGEHEAASRDAELAQLLRMGIVFHSVLNPAVQANLGGVTARLDLTPRELEVLQRMIAGRSNSQIAVDLHYSLATIRRDTSSIYRKLNVTNRAEAAAAAVHHGVVEQRPLG